MQSVQFTNWTDEDFTYTWDEDPFTFKAHTTIMLQDFLATHFAKHLVNKELIRRGLQVDDQIRSSLLKKCFPGGDPSKDSSSLKADVEVLNQKKMDSKPFCDSCDSKGVKHKKNCPKVMKAEEEFEGLK